jgi:hypothetical protein
MTNAKALSDPMLVGRIAVVPAALVSAHGGQEALCMEIAHFDRVIGRLQSQNCSIAKR